jgi:uncharacterized protein (TIGR04255 family)
MGTALKTPPVYLTIAQIRFNSILNLSEYLPRIQDSFRRSGYADYSKNQVLGFLVSDENKQPEPTQFESYIFGESSGQHNYVLNSDSLTIQSTNYGTFDDFLEKFIIGINIVHAVVKIDFVVRLGLRYLDHITPKEQGEGLDLYLDPGVMGMHGKFPGLTKFTFSETLNENEGIQLRSKTFIQNGPLTLPPDLFGNSLKIQDRFLRYVGVNAILDNDGFIESKNEFDLSLIKSNFVRIHSEISEAFKVTVTKYAIKVWNT